LQASREEKPGIYSPEKKLANVSTGNFMVTKDFATNAKHVLRFT
jgi:hypothetical protein